MQTKLAKYFNIIFKYAILVCLNFLWINFYLLSFTPAIITSSIVSIIILFIIEKILAIKNGKINTKLKNLEDFENFKTHVKLATKTGNLKMLSSIFENFKIELKKDYLLVGGKHAITCDFENNNLTDDAFFETIKKLINLKIDSITIFCINMQLNTVNKIKTINGKNVYFVEIDELYFSHPNLKNFAFENTFNFKPKSKTTIKQITAMAFNKKNAKSYFFSGFMLLFTSLFVPYSIYYLVFCSILFAFALFSLFNTKFNINKPFLPHIFK